MPPKAVIAPIAMKVKELKKGGKPAQVLGRHAVALEENKTLLAGLDSASPLQGFRLLEVGVAPEKSVASAGIASYGGTAMTNKFVHFGTATDFLCRVEGCDQPIVVPERFLNQKGNAIHPELFKVGDVIFLDYGSAEKKVDVGSWNGEAAVGLRTWSEVAGWMPANKVDRAAKEGKVFFRA